MVYMIALISLDFSSIILSKSSSSAFERHNDVLVKGQGSFWGSIFVLARMQLNDFKNGLESLPFGWPEHTCWSLVPVETLSKGYLPVFPGRLFHAILACILSKISNCTPFSRDLRGTDSLLPGNP